MLTSSGPASDRPPGREGLATEPGSAGSRKVALFGLAAGTVAGLLIGIGSPLLALAGGTLARESLALIDASLDDLDTATRQAGRALDASVVTLGTMEAAVVESSGQLEAVARSGEELGQVIAVDVPVALDAVRRALPGLEDSARILDRTMRAFRFVGVDYDAEVPLDQAVADIDASLAVIPQTLRDQSARFTETVSVMDSLAVQADLVSGEIGEVGEALAGLADTVSSIGETSAGARELVGRLNGLVRAVTVGGAILGAVTGLGLMISQGALWWWLREVWAGPTPPG